MPDRPIDSRPLRRRIVRPVIALSVIYLFAAYLIVPFAWEWYAHRHPSFDDNPRITRTGDDHPGDPLNVSLIGTKEQIGAIMLAAKWVPAAALGLKSDLKIAEDTVLSHPDADAPVSNLFLYGRKEDLAYEQPVGDNPRQRNHVRFWKTEKVHDDGRPIWIGAASYDERVGLSRTTGQITHHIATDVDKERDHLFTALKQTGMLAKVFTIDGFHHELEGRNGGGDRWTTDGDLVVGLIHADMKKPSQ